jgi:hypothetical protein
MKGSKYANRTKENIDFEKTCTPITLKMNYMSSKILNVSFFGGQGLYINEIISQFFCEISKCFIYWYKDMGK